MTVDVAVLSFAGCPNCQTTLDRITEAARQAGTEVRVTTRAMETLDDANRIGFPGSPTIWVNGQDPFALPALALALACRVYATPEGLSGVADRRPARCRLS